MDDSLDAWPAKLSRQVGAAIRRVREGQDVSAVKLAARTAQLGYPIHRVAISKLESGERAITVPELITLAAALNTVPLALLLPGTVDETVEILPDNEMPGGSAIGWFTGTTNPTPRGVHRDRGETSRLELTMRLNEVDELLRGQRNNLVQAESGPKMFGMPDELKARVEKSAERFREVVEALEQQRNSILDLLTSNGHD